MKGYPYDSIDAALVFPLGLISFMVIHIVNGMYKLFFCLKFTRKTKHVFPGYSFPRVDSVIIYSPKYAYNMAYLICGDSYCKWNLLNDSLAAGPRKVRDGWAGYPFDTIDATLIFPPGVGPAAYQNMSLLFHGEFFCKWNLVSDSLAEGPKRIKD